MCGKPYLGFESLSLRVKAFLSCEFYNSQFFCEKIWRETKFIEKFFGKKQAKRSERSFKKLFPQGESRDGAQRNPAILNASLSGVFFLRRDRGENRRFDAEGGRSPARDGSFLRSKKSRAQRAPRRRGLALANQAASTIHFPQGETKNGAQAQSRHASPPFLIYKRRICIKLRVCLFLCRLAVKCKYLQNRVQQKAKWQQNSN